MHGYDDGELIHLVFRPLADDVPVSIRTRSLLKTALRRHKLRCVYVEGVGEDVLASGAVYASGAVRWR
jgi:hypothetical protein